MMNETGVVHEPSFFSKLGQVLDPRTWMERFNISKDALVGVTLYLGIGFLAGFLLKRFGAYIFVFILGIVSLLVLQQLQVVSLSVNWAKANEIFGLQPVAIDGGIVTVYWEWVKMNAVLVFSFSVGFLIGLKIG
jgi:hypothetical protein